MSELFALDLFAPATGRAGGLGCAIEIAARIGEALEQARQAGMDRDRVAERMSYHLGERMSVNMLNNYAAQSKEHEISLRRAMALDAALERDVLLGLYLEKLGGRAAISADDAALLEWARLQHQENELKERRRALEAAIKSREARRG